jgi:hypothetical protein
MNKFYIYILFIIFGLCIYLYINKKDTFNVGGQVPLFMCSNEQYQNNPECLPDAFCQNLQDGEICTVDNLNIDENNRENFREYYENLKSGLSKFNSGLNCLYENSSDIENLAKNCPNSFLTIIGSFVASCASALPISFYNEQINIMKKLTSVLLILLKRWESIDNKYNVLNNIEVQSRQVMDNNRYGIPIINERTSRELIGMLTTYSFMGHEILDINHNGINRMIDGQVEYFPYDGTIAQKKQLLSMILTVEENFIIKVIDYLKYYSGFFGFREWKDLIFEIFPVNSNVYKRFNTQIEM